jgi:hypothetical protein
MEGRVKERKEGIKEVKNAQMQPLAAPIKAMQLTKQAFEGSRKGV